ncbi:MAG TPA: hypothetical protein PKK26_00360, partial [Candidatus Wallbacteria bacterium]|nr:hypothetical protein [Candidatus Wallbacteria bacterium]
MKYNKKIIFIIITALAPLLLSFNHALAADVKKTAEELKPKEITTAEKHKIDKELDACMDKNPSTAGMVECIDNAA